MAISRVGAASAATTSLTVPAHAVGDLMLMLAWRSGSSSAPTVPSGWTVLGTANQTGSTKCWVGLYYHVATSTSDTSGTWTSATGLVCMIYRQAAVPVAGDVSVQAGTSTTANYPAKTISDTVNSWFAALVGKGGGTGTISGLTKETSTSTTEEGWDSNAVRSTNWPSTNQTVTSPWGTATIEIRRSFDVLTPTIAGTASLSPIVAALNAFSATVAGTSSLSAPLATVSHNKTFAPTISGTSSLTESFPVTGTLDNFTRANENPLSDGGLWSNSAWSTTTTHWTVSSNVAKPASTASGAVYASYIPGTTYVDCEAWVDLGLPAPFTNHVGAGVRWTDGTSPTGYYVDRNESTGSGVNSILLIRQDAGGPTTLATATMPSVASQNDRVGIRAIGSTISIWYRTAGGIETLLASVTDTTYGSGNLMLYGKNTGGVSGSVPNPTAFGGGAITSAPIVELHRFTLAIAGTSSLTTTVSKIQSGFVTTQDLASPKPRFSGPPKLGSVALQLRLAQEQRAAPGPAPTVFRPVNASIAGTSSFAPTVRELHRITVTIAGTSSFSATLRELHRFAATIAGTSTLAATATELHRFTVTIAGTSSFASSLKALHLFTATIAGAGSLSAGTRLLRRFSATVAGTSSLSASLVELHRIAPSVAGTSSLTATVTKYHRFSASLAGIGSLSATLTALHRLSASIQGSSNLTAQVSKQRTLDPERPMPRFTGPPKLRNVPLRLRLAQQQLAAGSRPFGAIGVAINGSSSMAPTVRALHRFSASIAGHGTFTATLTPLRRFTASLAGSSSLSATLRGLHRLSATLSGTSSLAASVRELHRISVTVAGKGSLSANLAEMHRFSASLGGRSSVSASLTLYHRLQGSIAGRTSLSAAVSALHRLSASLAGRSSVSAALVSEHRLTLAVAGKSSLTVSISDLRAFAAGIAGNSSVTVRVEIHPVVGIAGTSSLTAVVTVLTGVRNLLPFDRPSDDVRTGLIHRDEDVGVSELGAGLGLIPRDTGFGRSSS